MDYIDKIMLQLQASKDQIDAGLLDIINGMTTEEFWKFRDSVMSLVNDMSSRGYHISALLVHTGFITILDLWIKRQYEDYKGANEFRPPTA